MGEEHSIIEITVPLGDVDEAVAQVCDEWGVDRAAVQVDQLDAQAGSGRVVLRITLLVAEDDTDFDDELDQDDDAGEDDDAADEDAELDDAEGDDEPLAGAEPDATPRDGEDAELAQARAVLEALLARMHVRAEVVATHGQPEPEAEGPVVVLDVRGDDLDPLIGRRGETLAALQYITRLILSKQFSRNVDLVVDVQGHKQRREEQLRRMARRMAEQAAERQRVMSLEPMPANERRIIHLELRDHPDVTTESVGDGDRRKVTIVPKPRAGRS